MIQRNTTGMEPHIKQRYQFAASSFVRMWGHKALNDHRIIEFCEMWSYKTETPPLNDNVVDQYFYYEFKSWRGY